jgi:hypothetical protein
MTTGTKGIGSHKHGTSGRAPKSPRLRHAMKLDAERSEIKDTHRIKDPQTSIKDLFGKLRK